MRILFITQFYPPETGATPNRIGDLVHRMASASNDVTVLTALPSYPVGRIYEGFRGRAVLEEHGNNVRVIRIWAYATKSKSFLTRLFSYLSFMATSLIAGIFRTGPQDFVVIESPPIFLGLPGLLLSRLKGAKLVTNVADLWPHTAVALGFVQNRLIIRATTCFEEFLYHHSDLITGQTQGIVESIRSRAKGTPVALISNGVSAEALLHGIERGEKRASARRELGIEGKFVIGFIGVHGVAQDLETILRASKLVSSYPDIFFAFFGDGPEKQKLVRMAEQLDTRNVRFYENQPRSKMPEILAAIDISLVPLKRRKLFDGALPSKLFESMGAGVPVILGVKGEAQGLVERSQGGICVEPEDAAALADAILRLHQDSDLCCSLGAHGREYVMQHYNREDIAVRFQRFLQTSRPEPT
jgi:glycosyltransferase involved in cell wall biosynthesis